MPELDEMADRPEPLARRSLEGPHTPCKWVLRRLGGRIELEEVEEFAYVVIGLGGVAHGGGAVDGVMGAPAHSFAGDEAGLSEVADDSLGCPFGDPDALGDVAQPHVALPGDAQQDLGVVGDEPPGLAVAAT